MPRHRKVVELVTDQIPVPISEAEQRIKALELASVCGEIDKLRADAAEHAGTERKKIRALDKRRRELAECVRTGNEMRDAQENFGFDKKDKAARGNGSVDA